MFCIQNIVLIFCTIPLVIPVSLKIDGLIDLGPNWNYGYRILSPNSKESKKPNRERGYHPPEDRPHLRIDAAEEERIRKDEEKLQETEERIRNIAAEMREARLTNVKQKDKKPEEDKSNKKQENLKKYKSKENGSHMKIDPSDSDTQTESEEFWEEEAPRGTKGAYVEESGYEEKKSKKKYTTTTYNQLRYKSWSSESKDSSLSDDTDEDKLVKNTFINDYEYITTTKKLKKHYTDNHYKDSFNISNKNESHNNLRNPTGISLKFGDILGSIIDKITNYSASVGAEILNNTLDAGTNKIGSKVNETFNVLKNISSGVINATANITKQMTTVRTARIYTNPHKVKDDELIVEFTNNLYKHTLKIFNTVKHLIDQYHIKKKIDKISRCYEDKFKEYLNETGDQLIKTRLGTQKVILNTIETSNRLVTRLVNLMIGDLDKKGVLRNSVNTAGVFKKALEKERGSEYRRACKKFGICRSGTGFSEFFTDILTILLRCDDRKFKQSIDAFTEVAKNTNFYKALQYETERKLKEVVEIIEKQPLITLRSMMMILKNIIMNKNKPLVVNRSGATKVNATLAFLEFIDLLDEKIPKDESNALEWADIVNSLGDYSEEKRYDIQDIMEVTVKHFKKTLKRLDRHSKKIVSKCLDVMLT